MCADARDDHGGDRPDRGLAGRGAVRARCGGDGAHARSRAGARARARRRRAVRGSRSSEPAPAQALAGRDAIVHLAGEPVAQRWSAGAKRAIRDSRVIGTRNLLAGLDAARSRVRQALISASAIGYYGAHGEEPLDEEAPARRGLPRAGVRRMGGRGGGGARAGRARGAGAHRRRARPRRRRAGEDAAAVPARRSAAPSPAGASTSRGSTSTTSSGSCSRRSRTSAGRARSTRPRPSPSTNREFSSALGRVLGRPALMPVPGLALRALYGEMAEIVTKGARVLPAKALVLGYEFAHPQPRTGAARGARGVGALRRVRADVRCVRRGAVLGLDDHPAGTLAEQVGGGRAEALLAGGGMDGRPVDHVRADAFGFLDERRARGCACGSGRCGS